jgi:hypothetical protein
LGCKLQLPLDFQLLHGDMMPSLKLRNHMLACSGAEVWSPAVASKLLRMLAGKPVLDGNIAHWRCGEGVKNELLNSTAAHKFIHRAHPTADVSGETGLEATVRTASNKSLGDPLLLGA